jgi:ElaB/YqjD/DUF883 family membrane-anchored ribosome-binding protein
MTPTVAEAAREVIQDRLDPALESLEDNLRDVRRAVTKGRHAVEDFAMSTAEQVRRRPLMSVAAAGAVGAVAGCVAGLVIGWRARQRCR